MRGRSDISATTTAAERTALDMTDAFSIRSGGKIVCYVESVETVAEKTERRLKMLEEAR